jgi:hypothetical protein
VRHNNHKLLQWEEEAAHFHELIKESKWTEAKESIRRNTLSGSVKADKQWIAQRKDYKHKQSSYMVEIREIQKIIAKTSQSMDRCH